MANTDSSRVHHEIDDLPNSFRDFGLEQILNDISELINGKGHVQLIRSGPFVSQVIVWETTSQIKKRAEINVDRSSSPPFINTISESVYSEDGSSTVATITTQVIRDGNKNIVSTNTTVTRP